jgi:hypothetical protein
VYIFGGGRSNGVLCSDPASEVWSALAPNINTRKYGSSFVVGGCLYFAGGNDVNDAMSSVDCYNVASDTWTAVADMLEGRSRSKAVTIGSAVMIVEQDPFDSLITKASRRRP